MSTIDAVLATYEICITRDAERACTNDQRHAAMIRYNKLKHELDKAHTEIATLRALANLVRKPDGSDGVLVEALDDDYKITASLLAPRSLVPTSAIEKHGEFITKALAEARRVMGADNGQ